MKLSRNQARRYVAGLKRPCDRCGNTTRTQFRRKNRATTPDWYVSQAFTLPPEVRTTETVDAEVARCESVCNRCVKNERTATGSPDVSPLLPPGRAEEIMNAPDEICRACDQTTPYRYMFESECRWCRIIRLYAEYRAALEALRAAMADWTGDLPDLPELPGFEIPG